MQRTHDRVKETGTATTGIVGSSITLTGAATAHQSFANVFMLDEPIYFACVNGNIWGTYKGHLSSSTNLVIDEIHETSSLSGSPPYITFNPVTFSGSSMDVFSTIPAEMVEEIFTKGQSLALSYGLPMC